MYLLVLEAEVNNEYFLTLRKLLSKKKNYELYDDFFIPPRLLLLNLLDGGEKGAERGCHVEYVFSKT